MLYNPIDTREIIKLIMDQFQIRQSIVLHLCDRKLFILDYQILRIFEDNKRLKKETQTY
jgi:hypothetical protein